MRTFLLGTFATVLVTFGLACSDDGDAPMDSNVDGGGATSSDAASEAGENTGRDAGDADAAEVRECSDDGFCHTTLPKNQVLHGVWGDGNGTVWSVSEVGSVLRWDGTQWTDQANRLGYLNTVWGSGPTDVWVGGWEGLFHGTGATPDKLVFEQVPGVLGEISAIWGLGPTDIWAILQAPEGSRVIHYGEVDGQLAWSTVELGTMNSTFNQVWGTAQTGVWIASTTFDEDTFFEKGEVFRKRPGASDFELLDLPGFPDQSGPFFAFGRVTAASIANDTEIVFQAAAVSGDAMLVHGSSTDSGETFAYWSEVDGTYQDPSTLAIQCFGPNDFWTAGDYGRVRHFDATGWTQMAVTNNKYPLVAPMYGMWAKNPNDFWIVGQDVALHFDPAKKR